MLSRSTRSAAATRPTRRDRPIVHRWGVRLVAFGGFVVVAAMFGPWVRSGSKRRSSFELVDLIDRLGFSPDGPIEPTLRWWPLVPLAVVVAVVLTTLRRGWIGAVLAIVVGAVVGAVGLAMRTVPETALIGRGWGSALAVVGGSIMIGGGITVLVSGRRSL